MRPRFLVSSLVALAATAMSLVQTPLGPEFVYQGRLKQAGVPVSGAFDLELSLWDAAGSGNPPVGGNAIGATQTLLDVPISDGLFTVTLNAAGEFGANAFNGSDRWLQIRVNGTTLAPRQPLTAAPHALYASNADRLDGLNSTAFLQSVPVPLSLSGTSATQIIRGDNSSSTGGATAVVGAATASGGATYGGRFESSSTAGTGMFGRATAASGSTYGVFGQSNSTAGVGVSGWAAATAGTTFGLYGVSASNAGAGVGGAATAASGTTYGVSGSSASPSGRGVFGVASAATGANAGVYGQTASATGSGVVGMGGFSGVYGENNGASSGVGVYGYASGGTPIGASGIFPPTGVYGRCDSMGGAGLFGAANAPTGNTHGVYAQSFSSAGKGVYGFAASFNGVTYGVHGAANTNDFGYAVYGSGDLGASGTKTFRIDHPDDPEHKYLLHYCTEGPEVMNFYSGNATLDGAGEAVIELPHYFAKINRDPRYSLTAVGAPMPMLHVAEEVDDVALRAGAKAAPGEPALRCSFRIAGGAPGARVSWRVEAVRNDRWVQRRGAPVEIEKQGFEDGRYQHPELYGQPHERGMQAATRASNP